MSVLESRHPDGKVEVRYGMELVRTIPSPPRQFTAGEIAAAILKAPQEIQDGALGQVMQFGDMLLACHPGGVPLVFHGPIGWKPLELYPEAKVLEALRSSWGRPMP